MGAGSENEGEGVLVGESPCGPICGRQHLNEKTNGFLGALQLGVGPDQEVPYQSGRQRRRIAIEQRPRAGEAVGVEVAVDEAGGYGSMARERVGDNLGVDLLQLGETRALL